jgi:hypothetical protein
MSNKRRARKRPAAPHANLKPGFYVLNVQHDDGCPTIRSQRQSDCTCSEVEQRLVDGETYFKRLKKAGAR